MTGPSIEIEFELADGKFDGIEGFGPEPTDIVDDLGTVEGLDVSASTLRQRVREDGREVSVVDATLEIGEGFAAVREGVRKMLDGVLGVFRNRGGTARFKTPDGEWVEITNMPSVMTDGDWDTGFVDALAEKFAVT